MLRPSQRERRHGRRFVLSGHSPKECLSILQVFRNRRYTTLQARIHDVSSGGVNLRASRSIAESQVIRCELHLPGLPAPISTLLQVRWTRKSSKGHSIGLQYVL